jgi:nucleolar complex protein 2
MDADAFMTALGAEGSDDDFDLGVSSEDDDDLANMEEDDASDIDVLVQGDEGEEIALEGRRAGNAAKMSDDDADDEDAEEDEEVPDVDDEELVAISKAAKKAEKPAVPAAAAAATAPAAADKKKGKAAAATAAAAAAAEEDEESDDNDGFGDLEGTVSRHASEGGVRDLPTDDDDDDDFGAMGEMEDDEDDGLDDEERIKRHMAELEHLRKTDPEFYAHLKETSKDLFAFGDDIEAEDAAAEEAIMARKRDAARPKQLIETMTKEHYLEVRQAMGSTNFGLRSLLRLVRLFKSAVALQCNTEEKKQQRKEAGEVESRKGKKGNTPNVGPRERSPAVIALLQSKLFNHFVQYAIRTIPTALAVYVARESAARLPPAQAKLALPESGQLTDATAALSDGPTPWAGASLKGLPIWSKVEPLVRTFLLSAATFLGEVVDAVTTRFVLRALLPAVPLLEGVPAAAPKLLKIFVKFWAHGADSLSNVDDSRRSAAQKADKKASSFGVDHATRIDSFLAVRRMCLTLPPRSQVLEATLKGMYLAFVRVSKNMNQHTHPTVIFMCNCLTEIYGMDPHSSYQHTFVYIRQLAIHLRSTIQKASEEATRSVYNWQFLNSLRVWAHVLAAHAADAASPLAPLVYPFTQVCLGVIELTGAPGYFPVRFAVSEFLNLVAAKCKVYIPLAPHLLAVLNSSILAGAIRQPKGEAAARAARDRKVSDVKYKLHVSPAVMASQAFHSLTLGRTFDALTHHLAIYSHSIAFPELVLPVKFLLRRFSKASRNQAAVRSARQLLTAITETAQNVLLRRVGVSFTPRDLLSKGISGVDTLKHPEVLASLNAAAAAAAANSAFGVLNNAASHAPGALAQAVRAAAKQSPLEALWSVRERNMIDAERKEIVISAVATKAKRGDDEDADDIDVKRAVAEGEEDDEVGAFSEGDFDDDDDDDEDEEEAPQPAKAKKTKPAPLSTAERIAAAAKAAAAAVSKKQAKRSQPVEDAEESEEEAEAGWGSDDDQDDVVEDLVLSDDEDGADANKKKRLANKGKKAANVIKAKTGPIAKKARK